MPSSKTALIFLATFTVAGSARVADIKDSESVESLGDAYNMVVQSKNESLGGEVMAKCKANGDGVGMSITWGIPKSHCLAECGPTNAHGFTYQYQFIRSFSTTYDKKCECSSGGKKYVEFKPLNKQQAMRCREGNSWDVKEACWKAYMKARGTRFMEFGSRRVPRYTVPFTPTDFIVQRMCRDTCEGEDCEEVVMPGAIEGLDDKDKAAVGQGINKLMNGDADSVSDDLKELIGVLPEDDLDAAEFAAIDTDGDGELSVDELAGFYTGFTPDQIRELIPSGKTGVSGPDGFKDFKDAMRNYNPNVDLISGAATTFVLQDDEVREVKPQWKAVAVECMKDGKPAPGECEGTEDDALAHFDMNC